MIPLNYILLWEKKEEDNASCINKKKNKIKLVVTLAPKLK
jgi:hypothetical protein